MKALPGSCVFESSLFSRSLLQGRFWRSSRYSLPLGWQEAVSLMGHHEVLQAFLPPDLAYGSEGFGGFGEKGGGKGRGLSLRLSLCLSSYRGPASLSLYLSLFLSLGAPTGVLLLPPSLSRFGVAYVSLYLPLLPLSVSCSVMHSVSFSLCDCPCAVPLSPSVCLCVYLPLSVSLSPAIPKFESRSLCLSL